MNALTLLLGAAIAAAASSSSGTALPKYRLRLDGFGLASGKKEYHAGEEVTVTYSMVATDTDYWFTLDCEDVKLKRDYSVQEGYILKFTMPDHDVCLKVNKRNSMMCLNPKSMDQK